MTQSIEPKGVEVMEYEFTNREVHTAFNTEGLNGAIQYMIEGKIEELGMSLDSDPDIIDKMQDEMWPSAMVAVLQEIMDVQSPEGSWDIRYNLAEGTQYFSIISTFKMGARV